MARICARRQARPHMKIQAYLTAAAINLKRLAAAVLALFAPWMAYQGLNTGRPSSKRNDPTAPMHELAVA